MAQSTIEAIYPFFIVSGVEQSIVFYQQRLEFETRFKEPAEKPFFAILGSRGCDDFPQVRRCHALPNPMRDPEMRWDAYCSTADPDALATEFAGRGTTFSNPLKDTADGLRGFEITDPDGYVLFFGRPR